MGKRGPKLTEINWEQVDSLCAIHCTIEEIAGVIKCSVDTLERACKREHNLKLAEYTSQKRAPGRASLRRRQYQKAMEGNATMLIWLGKQWLNQSDKIAIAEETKYESYIPPESMIDDQSNKT